MFHRSLYNNCWRVHALDCMSALVVCYEYQKFLPTSRVVLYIATRQDREPSHRSSRKHVSQQVSQSSSSVLSTRLKLQKTLLLEEMRNLRVNRFTLRDEYHIANSQPASCQPPATPLIHMVESVKRKLFKKKKKKKRSDFTMLQ